MVRGTVPTPAEGIHIYTLNGKVRVALGSEGLPSGCEEDCGLPWKDEYFHGNCLEEVADLEKILKGAGYEVFNRWLSTIDSDSLIQKIREGNHAKKGQVIQRLVITGGGLEMDGK